MPLPPGCHFWVVAECEQWVGSLEEASGGAPLGVDVSPWVTARTNWRTVYIGD